MLRGGIVPQECRGDGNPVLSKPCPRQTIIPALLSFSREQRGCREGGTGRKPRSFPLLLTSRTGLHQQC